MLGTRAGVEHVDISCVDGGLEAFVDGITFECGSKGTESAVTNAVVITEDIFRARGALPRVSVATGVAAVPNRQSRWGIDLRFLAASLEPVAQGEVFARRVRRDT